MKDQDIDEDQDIVENQVMKKDWDIEEDRDAVEYQVDENDEKS